MSFPTFVWFGNIEKRIARISPYYNGGSSGVDSFGDKITEVFNAATPLIDSNGIRVDYVTAAINGNSAGYYGDLQYPRSLDIEMYIRFRLASITNTRVFIGFTDQSAATMVGTDHPTGNYFGMEYYTSRGDTKFRAFTSSGSSQNSQDSIAADTSYHDLYLRLWSDYGNSDCQMQIDDNDIIDIIGNMPNNATNLRLAAHVSTLNATTKHLELGSCMVATKY